MLRSPRFLAAGAVGIGAIALFACGSHDAATPAPSHEAVAATAQAYDTNTDLISPATCGLRSNHLVGCTVATRQLTGLSMTTAVPLRTKFTAVKTGNCATSYPLQVTLKADGANDVVYSYLAPGSAAIKRKDGQPMPTVTLVDGSPTYTHAAAFDATCRISLTISSNEPDVDSKPEAQAIIDALTQDLNAKTVIAQHYQALTLYNSAFSFLQTVANSFLVELTNDTIQQLRTSAQGAITALGNLMSSSCTTATNPDGTPILSGDDQNNLLILMMDLPQLGQASDWQNADGGTKTLADLLGPDQAKVLATVQKLAAQTDGGMNFDDDYAKAEADVQAATAKLAQAKTQLASWLQ